MHLRFGSGLEERFLLFDEDGCDDAGDEAGAGDGAASGEDRDGGLRQSAVQAGRVSGGYADAGSGLLGRIATRTARVSEDHQAGERGDGEPRLHRKAVEMQGGEPRFPGRPSLPLLLAPAVALWLSIRAGAQIVWQRYAGEGVVYDAMSALSLEGIPGGWAIVFAACALAVFLAAIAWKAWGAGPLAFIVAGAVCLGLATGMLCWNDLLSQMDAMSSASGTFHAKVTSDSTESTFSPYSEGVLVSEDGARLSVRIYWDSEDEVLPLGAEFDSRGSFSALDADSGGLSMFESRIGGSFSPSDIEDARWGNSLQGVFGSVREHFAELLREHSGSGEILLEGIVLGNRSQLSGSDLYESFKIAGIAHLLAVSGSHMSIVMSLVSWVIGTAGFSRRTSVAAIAVVTVSYLMLTGMQPSAFRACLMAVLGSFSWLAHRRKSSLSALCLAILAMLELDPSNAFSVGFELSVLGVMGLCIFMPLATTWMSAILPGKPGRKLSEPLAMTFVAHVATMPVSVPLFGMLSLIGPFVNIVASPAISFFLGGGILAMFACAVCDSAGSLVLDVLCMLGDAFCSLVELSATVPHASIACYAPSALAWGVTLACAVLLWARWPMPTRSNLGRAAAGLAAAIGVAIVFSWPSGEAQIVMLDVGQGDSILIRDGDAKILIDTGQQDSMLRQELGRNGIYSLDAVVITHFDDDHCGSLAAMESMVTVDEVIVSEGSIELGEADEGSAEVLQTAAELAGEGNVVEMSEGDSIEVSDRMTLTMVWPEETVEESGNGDSLCLLLEYDADGDGSADFRALFTGDAESEELEQMADDGLGDIDLMKVGHHGSSVALSDEALEALDPQIALISVGEGNSYGHPSQVTLELLEEHGVEYWRTDLDGEITLVLGVDGCTVSCANI